MRRPAQFGRHDARSLRLFQRSPDKVGNFADAQVRIWSEEHRAYWRRSAAGAGNGYTVHPDQAGIVALPHAFLLTRHCDPEKEIWFEFVRAAELKRLGTKAAHVAACLPHLPPLDMVLHCPRCGHQHVDAPDPAKGWNNPPHRSHLCHGCGCIWRPADVPTCGVERVATAGSADSWAPGDPTSARSVVIVRLIEELRADEGDTVVINCENPEGPPQQAIDCNGGWTGWNDLRFDGATLLECLRAAAAARAATDV